MHSINTNLPSSMIQNNEINEILNGITKQQNHKNSGVNQFCDAGACVFAPSVMSNMLNFDDIMDNVVGFKDMLTTTNDRMALMRQQGESLLALINRAHGENVSQEELDGINAEAKERIAEIEKLFTGTDFNGVNPMKTPVSLSIPNWQDVVKQFSGVDEAQEAEENPVKEITDKIADIQFDFDMSTVVDGKALNMTASANIQIGYCDDGSLQITVDASLDYDLSGISEKGAQSDDAMELIMNFLNLLNGKQNTLFNANSLFDSMFGVNNGFSFDGLVPVEESQDSSGHIQGKILQQASINISDFGTQPPSIAINML